MKITTRAATAASAALLLALTGCSQGDQNAAGTEQPTTPDTTTSAPAAIDPSTSASPTPTLSPEATEATPEPTPRASTDWDAERDYGDGELSSRGFLIKEPGQWAGIEIDGNHLVDFRIREIEVDPECRDFSDDPLYQDRDFGPENGHFVALHMDVETFDGVTAENGVGFGIGQGSWRAINADGTTSAATIDQGFEAYNCFSEREQLPSEMNDNERASGVIVLDVEDPSGVLIYDRMTWEGDMLQWEWAY